MTTNGAHRTQRGATAVEYAILISLMAAVIFGMIATFGGGVTDLFTGTNTSIEDGITP